MQSKIMTMKFKFSKISNKDEVKK